MPKIHPKPDALRGMWGLLPESRRRVLRHAHECAACRAALEAERAGPVYPLSRFGSGYDQALDRVLRDLEPHIRLANRERAEAPTLLAELQRHTPGRREMLVRNARRFRSFSLCLLLLDRCREVSPDDPRSGEAWALLALCLTDFLDPRVYGAGLIEDIRGRSWSFLANTRRISGDLLGAERAFLRAEEHLRRGTRDRLERAQTLVLKATLRRVQCRFGEAERLLRRALSIWLWAGESRRAIEAMITWSVVYADHGEPERGIRLLREASELPAALSDPCLALSIHHNLAMLLIEAEKFLEAEGLLLHNRELYGRVQFPGSSEGSRQWAEGTLARGLGRMEEAEACFTDLRSLFLQQGRTRDAALMSLELALICLSTGRAAKAKDLAHEALAVFSSLRVKREALAAFLLAQWAEALQASESRKS
jgi:tetratricopeptide (TPR) repeat protein